jgi:hypothetical protein
MTFHMESTEWYFENTWLKNILRGRDPTLLASSYPYTNMACSNRPKNYSRLLSALPLATLCRI